MVRIFRIENIYGFGPYFNDEVYDDILHNHTDARENSPNPFKDFDDNNLCLFNFFGESPEKQLIKFVIDVKDNLINLIIDNGYKHGFVSLSSLKQWFTKDELLSLESYGYFLNVYEFEYYDLDKMYVLPKQIIVDTNILKDNFCTYKVSDLWEMKENEF